MCVCDKTDLDPFNCEYVYARKMHVFCVDNTTAFEILNSHIFVF